MRRLTQNSSQDNTFCEEKRGSAYLPVLLILMVVVAIGAYAFVTTDVTVTGDNGTIEPSEIPSGMIMFEHQMASEIDSISIYTADGTEISDVQIDEHGTVTVKPPNGLPGNYTVETTYKNGSTETAKIVYRHTTVVLMMSETQSKLFK
jgi:hypothetical protein